MIEMKVGGTYDFQTIAPNIIGDTYKSVKVIDIRSYSTAITQKPDIDAINANVFLSIGQTNVPDPKIQKYILIRSGDKTDILSLDWIKSETVVSSTVEGVLKITIPNITTEQKSKIETLFRALDIKDAVFEY